MVVYMPSDAPIPTIDLFAGPGGLSEGFSRPGFLSNRPGFRTALSIEKDPIACQTLELRAFTRQFKDRLPTDYYEYLRGGIDRDELYRRYPSEHSVADREAWQATLGETHHEEVIRRISEALDGATTWVLLGGPPCQAYSLAGRSRMRPVLGEEFDRDHRHFLYKEYLRILADESPPVFVFENVKGLLSSTVAGQRTFEVIRRDLQQPARAFEQSTVQRPVGDPQYRLFALEPDSERVDSQSPEIPTGEDFVVRAELHGVPQARHRVIILGVRSDWLAAHHSNLPGNLPTVVPSPSVRDAIRDLPPLRSGISREADSFNGWVKKLSGSRRGRRFDWNRDAGVSEQLLPVVDLILQTVNQISEPECGRGGRFLRVPSEHEGDTLHRWFSDECLNGVINHETRSHIPDDLRRYLFASAFGAVHERSANLNEFPRSLLPRHSNVVRGSSQHFVDRFRVQIADSPSTTITSHISKDGHYFIHYDPAQSRSLTVREAARLQTFPDNYFFEGTRTQQYVQVGNAVPPLLANQIADIVHQILRWPETSQQIQLPEVDDEAIPVAQTV